MLVLHYKCKYKKVQVVTDLTEINVLITALSRSAWVAAHPESYMMYSVCVCVMQYAPIDQSYKGVDNITDVYQDCHCD